MDKTEGYPIPRDLPIEDLAVGVLRNKFMPKGIVMLRTAVWLFTERFFVSFPKSGRTWVESILEQLGKQPEIIFTHDAVDAPWEDYLTYTEIETFFKPKIYRGKKVVLMVRDPRDVIVSYFWQKTVREPWMLPELLTVESPYRLEKFFDQGIEVFIEDEIYGIPKIVAFMNLWAEECKKYDNILLVTYEDMRKDTEAEVGRIFKHWGIAIFDKSLRTAIAACTFEKLQSDERQRADSFGKPVQNSNQLKARRGLVGGYKDELDQKTIDYVNDYLARNLDSFYERYVF